MGTHKCCTVSYGMDSRKRRAIIRLALASQFLVCGDLHEFVFMNSSLGAYTDLSRK
jgi:hypothetical protein